MAKLTFVVGKGGVGKTTISCSYALRTAAFRPRDSVLLISTDPAHSLADVLQVRLGSATSRIQTRGTLSAWQIDADKEFSKVLSGNREDILSIVESGTFFTRDEIAPLLDTTLPGMAEVAALLVLQKLLKTGRYDHIIVDTAPFGHTLRLFEMPAHFQKFLNFLQVASSRDALLAQHFGGHVKKQPAHDFLDRWEAMIQQVRQAFSAKNAEIFLVTSPETFALNEAVRSIQSLSRSVPEMQISAIVLNRVVMAPGHCTDCGRRRKAVEKTERFLRKNFPGIPVLLGVDPGNPILGAGVLRHFGESVFGKKTEIPKHRAKLVLPCPRGKTVLNFQAQPWPAAESALSFTVGKGGVGKTTTTAALAFHSRAIQSTVPVTVCSTDPAPSLDDIFRELVGDARTMVLGDPGLTAVEIDSVAEFRQWAARIKTQLDSELSLDSGGLHVDLTFEKQVFAALMEVAPPGVDEVFAIFRILDLLRDGGKVLIDMAPTGHALELLRMPERIQLWSRLLLKSLASHRNLALAQDVAVEIASLGQEVRKLIAAMRDPERSRIWAVMLPEPVPDGQTRRLIDAVEKLGLKVDSLLINRVRFPQQPEAACEWCARSVAWQRATLQSIAGKYHRYQLFIAPEMPQEIAGRTALKRFTSKIWRIVDGKSKRTTENFNRSG